MWSEQEVTLDFAGVIIGIWVNSKSIWMISLQHDLSSHHLNVLAGGNQANEIIILNCTCKYCFDISFNGTENTNMLSPKELWHFVINISFEEVGAQRINFFLLLKVICKMKTILCWEYRLGYFEKQGASGFAIIKRI